MPVIQNLETGEACEVSQEFVKISRVLSEMLEDTIPLKYKYNDEAVVKNLDGIIEELLSLYISSEDGPDILLLDYIKDDYKDFFEEFAVENTDASELKSFVGDILEKYKPHEICDAFALALSLDMKYIELALGFVIGVSIKTKYFLDLYDLPDFYHNEVIYHIRVRLGHISAREDSPKGVRESYELFLLNYKTNHPDVDTDKITSDYHDYGALIELIENPDSGLSNELLKLIDFTASFTMTDNDFGIYYELVNKGEEKLRREYRFNELQKVWFLTQQVSLKITKDDVYRILKICKFAMWFETSLVTKLKDFIVYEMFKNWSLIFSLDPIENKSSFIYDDNAYNKKASGCISIMWKIKHLNIKKQSAERDPFYICDYLLISSVIKWYESEDWTFCRASGCSVKCKCRGCAVNRYMKNLLITGDRAKCLKFH